MSEHKAIGAIETTPIHEIVAMSKGLKVKVLRDVVENGYH
jgi:hypothetical protein